MDGTGKMKNFRIISLHYDMKPGYRGKLSVGQEIRFSKPEAGDPAIVYGQFQIAITGEEQKEFSLVATGEGTFEIPADQVERAAQWDKEVLDPLAKEMMNRTVDIVEKITAAFGITPIQLKTTLKKNESD